LVAALVTLFGVLIGVLGIFHSDMYDIGVMVTFIGVIGIVVRLGDWVRWLRR
jgi:hypothetical protein